MKRFLLPLALLIVGGCAQAGTPNSDNGRQVLKLTPPPAVTVRRSCDNLRETMVLFKTDKVNKFGNPLWALMLPDCRAYTAVVGRAHTQNLDRNQSGNQSPLPPGAYRVGQVHDVRGLEPELGNTIFIDLVPNFRTERTDLGIHWDPSFNRDKEKDGTAACIALTNAADLDAVNDAIKRLNIHTLMVVK
jgi:hypothetical protein